MMKHQYVLLLMALFSNAILLAQPTIEWQKSYGGSTDDQTLCIISTSSGGYVAAGRTYSNDGNVLGNHGQSDFWIIKLDSQGNLLRKRTFGGSKQEYTFSIIQTNDGGFITTGFTESNDGNVHDNHGATDAWVLKLDIDLNIVWSKTYGSAYFDDAYAITQATDGGYVFAGRSLPNGASGFDVLSDLWIVKMDVSGNVEWEKRIGGTKFESAWDIQTTSDGGYIVAAQTESNDGDVSGFHGYVDIWLIKLDEMGNVIWERAYGGSGWEYSPSILPTQDGGYILSATTQSIDGDINVFNHGMSDYWVVKLNAIGNIIWQKVMGGSDIDQAWGVAEAIDGGYLVTGGSYSFDGDVPINNSGAEFWSLKFSQGGDLEWNKTVGSNGSDWGHDILATSDGGCVVSGAGGSGGDASGNHGNVDFWIVKLSPASAVATKALDNPVWQISPNPTDGLFQIEGEDPGNIKSVSISNLIGNHLTTSTSSKIDISALPTGLYTITIQTKDGKVAQQKIVKQ